MPSEIATSHKPYEPALKPNCHPNFNGKGCSTSGVPSVETLNFILKLLINGMPCFEQ